MLVEMLVEAIKAYIIIWACVSASLIPLAYLEWRHKHPKKPPLCESCRNLKEKRSKKTSMYRYACGAWNTMSNGLFDVCPEFCRNYDPVEDNDAPAKVKVVQCHQCMYWNSAVCMLTGRRSDRNGSCSRGTTR